QRGISLINGICLNCTYGDGKPVICCGCEGPLNYGFCSFRDSRAGNSFPYDPNPNSFDDSQNLSYYPPQTQYQTYSCELCRNDDHYGYDCPPQVPSYPVIHHPPQETSVEMLQARENLMKSIQTFFKKFDYISSRDKPIALLLAHERFSKIKQAFREEQHQLENIQKLLRKLLNDLEYLENSSNAISPKEPDNSLSIGDEHLDTILETKSDEVIKSSVEDLIPIPSEFEDTSESDSECILPSCDDFSPIIVFEEKILTFSNPLFNSNDDFTSSDDESLSDEDVSEENVKIYSYPLFEFDDEYISSDINPFFDKVLENIESKDSYDFNLDESDLLVTPLSDVNEDECLDPRGDIDEINDFENGYYDSEGDILYLETLIGDDTTPNLPPMVFLDRDLRSLSDESNINDLMTEDKVFDLDIHDQIFSPTYDCLDFEDSSARGFVHHPVELQFLAYGNPMS
nr:hypothetical protein [Tanacetum cinerariifolium]